MPSRLVLRAAVLFSITLLLALAVPAASLACSYFVDSDKLSADVKAANFVAEGRATTVIEEGPWITVELMTVGIYKGAPVESVVVREPRTFSDSPCEVGRAQEGASYYIVGTERGGSVELADGLFLTSGDCGHVINQVINSGSAEPSSAPPSIPGKSIPLWRVKLAVVPYGLLVVPIVVIVLTIAIGALLARRART